MTHPGDYCNDACPCATPCDASREQSEFDRRAEREALAAFVEAGAEARYGLGGGLPYVGVDADGYADDAGSPTWRVVLEELRSAYPDGVFELDPALGVIEQVGAPPALHVGEFGRAADRTLDEVRSLYNRRGGEYGDTFATDEDWDADDRRDDALALVRVKIRRLVKTQFTHRDSAMDLLAYLAAFVSWNDQSSGGWM